MSSSESDGHWQALTLLRIITTFIYNAMWSCCPCILFTPVLAPHESLCIPWVFYKSVAIVKGRILASFTLLIPSFFVLQMKKIPNVRQMLWIFLQGMLYRHKFSVLLMIHFPSASTNEVVGSLIGRTKRMSVAVGPSSFATRKKKIKKNDWFW